MSTTKPEALHIADLESQLSSSGYTAADMATAAAQGFRDGVASVAASAGSEPVAHLWQHSETGRTRVVMPDMVVDASATWLPVGPLYLHPSPPEGMAGWMPIETRPVNYQGSYLLANGEGQVAPVVDGVIHNNIGTTHDWRYGEAATHWMPLPAPPIASEAKEPK